MANIDRSAKSARAGADFGGSGNRWLWICLAVSALILVARKPDAFTRPQFWAEDALPFYLEARYVGPDAFTRSYAGYHHFFPRLTAWCASFIDPCLAPAFFVGFSLLATLGIIALIFSERLDLSGKPMLALAVVLVPHSGEIFLTPTNVQWLGALAIFLTVLKADPLKASDWIVDGVVILALGLSGFFIVLLLPFFILRAMCRRSWKSGVILAMASMAGALQVFEYWKFVQSPDSGAPVHWPAYFTFLSLHVPLELFGSKAWAAVTPRWLAITGGVLAMAGFGVIAWSPRREQALPRYAMLVFALILVMAASRRVRFDGPPADDFINVDRYVVLPRILLLWILGSTATKGTVRGRVALALFSTSMLVTLPYFRFPPLLDLQWHRYCADLRAGKEVTVPINPDWSVTFPARPSRSSSPHPPGPP